MARNKKEREETRSGVLLEDLDGKLDLVLEGYTALDKKIDKNHEEFREFVEETNFKFDVVFAKFDEVDKRFNEVDRKFDEVNKQFVFVFRELKDIRQMRVA